MKQLKRFTRVAAVVAMAVTVSVGFSQAMRLDSAQRNAPNAPIMDAKATKTGRLALVVANSAYPDADDPRLPLKHDAEVLANSLRKNGFSVDFIENAGRADLTAATERLQARVEPGSTVLIYFGGFAAQSQDRNYLLPTDAVVWKERDIRSQGVSIEALLANLKKQGAHTQVALIDASRRNPYERRFRSYSHGLAPFHPEDEAAVLSAAGDGMVTDDPDDDSRLVTAFVNGLNSSDGVLKEAIESTRSTLAASASNQPQ